MRRLNIWYPLASVASSPYPESFLLNRLQTHVVRRENRRLVRNQYDQPSIRERKIACDFRTKTTFRERLEKMPHAYLYDKRERIRHNPHHWHTQRSCPALPSSPVLVWASYNYIQQSCFAEWMVQDKYAVSYVNMSLDAVGSTVWESFMRYVEKIYIHTFLTSEFIDLMNMASRFRFLWIIKQAITAVAMISRSKAPARTITAMMAAEKIPPAVV